MAASRAHYSDWANTLEKRSRTAARELARRLDDHGVIRRIFDFGFGDGAFLAEIGHCFPEADLLGSDISVEAVQKAGMRLPTANLEQEDGVRSLSAAKDQFDLIVLSHVLYYFPASNWRRLMEQVAARLNPHGRIALSLVSNCSDAYREPLRARMEQVRAVRGMHARDGEMHFVEEIQPILPEVVSAPSWQIEWGVQLPDRKMHEFLRFLYRVQDTSEPRPVTTWAAPAELRMVDGWMLLQPS
jgi:trans-aconitate methyltransferase